jgi:hypothetical protein
MAFGPSLTHRPRKPVAEEVRPVTAALFRIVVLAVLAVAGAGWGIWAYYTHALRPAPRPPPSAPASQIEIEVQ